MNHWAIGPLNGLARVFIQSSNPGEVLLQIVEGEVVAPIPGSVRYGGQKIILRADLQFDIVEPTDG